MYMCSSVERFLQVGYHQKTKVRREGTCVSEVMIRKKLYPKSDGAKDLEGNGRYSEVLHSGEVSVQILFSPY